MDLRKYIRKPDQVDRAKKLVLRGVLGYQPFIFSDDLEVGVGYEFLSSENSGLVYWPTVDPTLPCSPGLKRFFLSKDGAPVSDSVVQKFSESNANLRGMYDYFVDTICNSLGVVSNLTFADIGCNAGYFPISFARRGARLSAGYDREDHSDCFELLNEILGVKAKFFHRPYDGRAHTVTGVETYDVVTSVAVLCHLSDTLQHLSFLGSIAKKALFIFTPVTSDDDYCIRFGEPNKYYKQDSFPLCFDNIVRPSSKLLVKSLELMGFTQIIKLPNVANGMPSYWFDVHDALLAIRS